MGRVGILENDAKIETSKEVEIDLTSKKGKLYTTTFFNQNPQQNTPDIENPTEKISTLDFDEFVNDPTAPPTVNDPFLKDKNEIKSETVTTTVEDPATGAMSSNIPIPQQQSPSGAVDYATGLGAGGIGGLDVVADSTTYATNSASVGDLGTPQPSSDLPQGTNSGSVLDKNVQYEAPYTPATEADIDASVLTMTPAELSAYIGNMTAEEYAQFIEGIKNYYQGQLDTFDLLINGNQDQMGYVDYIDWFMEFWADHQLHQYWDEINRYDGQIHEIVDQYDYVMTADWFKKNFPNTETTWEDYRNMTKDEQLAFLIEQEEPRVMELLMYKESYIKWIDEQVKEEFGDLNISTFDEYYAAYNDLQTNVEKVNEAIKLTKNLIGSAWYDYLPYLKEYNDYQFHEFTEEELKAVAESKYEEFEGIYDFEEFHEQYPDITPIDYLLALRELYPDEDHSYDCIWGIETSEELLALIEVYANCPQFAKTYSYLYSVDPKQAEQYLKDCKYEINAIIGQIRAQNFLSTLKEADGDNDDALEAIANSLGVEVEGLKDGLISFGEGVYYSIEALAVALGICEENRVMSPEEYKRMYILQALLPKEAQVQAGLLVDNGDGTYSNNTENNPFGIIDFTKTYTGLWLHHKYSIAQGIGNMLPSILLSAVNPAAGMWALGVSAGGNAYHSAMVDGKSYFDALFYGLFTGTSEAITERIFGGLPFLSDIQVTSFATYLKSIGFEAFQESFQGAMDYLYKAMFMGEPFPDLSDADGWKRLLEDLGTQGAYGAITAGFLQSPNLALSIYNMHNFNVFMNAHEITNSQQQEALKDFRKHYPEYAKLSDAEIKTKFGRQLASLAIVNKVAFENQVSTDVANLMLVYNTDAETATLMLEENISFELAQKIVEQRHADISDDEATRDFIKRYLMDSDIEIPKYINPELASFLERYKDDPNCTQPLMPDSLVKFLKEASIESFFGGEEGLASFYEEVDQAKERILEEIELQNLDEQFVGNYRDIGFQDTAANMAGYFEAVIEKLSHWKENGYLNESSGNNLVFLILSNTIMNAQISGELPIELIDQYRSQIQAIKQSFIEYRASQYVDYFNSIGLHAEYSQDINGLVFTGLEPNSKYEIKVDIKDPRYRFISNRVTFVVRTDENGVGKSIDLMGNNFLGNFDGEEPIFEHGYFQLTYSDKFVHGETQADFIFGSPFFDALSEVENGFGINQGTFRYFDFSGDTLFDGDPTTNANLFFEQALDGSIPAQTRLLNELKQVVRSYIPGLSDADIIAYLKKLDSEGACSHAATVNQFVLQWKDHPDLFKQAFGYDLYRVDSTGQRVLNGELLLADYYTYLNQNNTGLFNFDGGNPIYLDPETHDRQEYSSTRKFEDFLNWKLEQSGSDVRVTIDSTEIADYQIPMPFDSLAELLHRRIHQEGASFDFSFFIDYDQGEKIIMYRYNADTGLFDIPTSTDEWFSTPEQFESGLSKRKYAGHATTIVDASTEGLYVQSWGKVYFIPFDSLPNSEYSITEFVVHETTINNNQ